MERLPCGCSIDHGRFIVSEGCRQCRECNAVAAMHPFGRKRLDEIRG